MKFHTDQHFIYITARVDEHKEELQSYYKLTKRDLEEITKDWLEDLLIPVDPVEMLTLNLIAQRLLKRSMTHPNPAEGRRLKKSKT
jgi:hypothetical protein